MFQRVHTPFLVSCEFNDLDVKSPGDNIVPVMGGKTLLHVLAREAE